MKKKNSNFTKGKVPNFTRVARDSSTRLINLLPSVHTCYPPSSINATFHGYSKLELHGTEESRNRCLIR